MTCAMQLVKPTTSSMAEQWTTLFPDFTTLTGSRLFIKKLMAVSLSAITYIRDIFPDKAYGERNLCGLKLKLLTEDSGLESVNKFINLIRSCYEAVDKKYLQQLSIGIGTDAENKDEVLESYTINFRYREDEFSVSNKTSSVRLNEDDPTVEATFWLLKSIMTVSDILGPVPKNAYLTMKLLYNDEITPDDYEPPGFGPCNIEKFSYPESTVKLELGKVSTDFNNYKMYLKTALSKEPLSQLLEESMMAESQKQESKVEADQEEDVFPPSTTLTKSGVEKPSPANLAQEVDCVCKCKQDSDTGILECSFCGRKQHAICYGITKTDEVDSSFYCIHCINEAPVKSSQEDMIHSLDGKEQQELCAFRRALVFCTSLKQVTPYQLERGLKCNKKLARDIVERLEFEGFVRKSGQKYTVNENKIRINGYQEYFPRDVKDSARTKHSKEQRNTKRPESADLMEVESVSPKKKTNARIKTDPMSQNSLMDFHINEKAQKLDLKEKRNSTESQQTNRSSRRRSLRVMTENDSQEYQGKTKRRCFSTKETIKLGK